MLPAAIGWLAAGGSWMSFGLWSLMAIIGVWQPPHFWLVMLAHGDDYRRRPAANRFTQFDRTQLHRLLLVWTAAFASLTLTPIMTRMVTSVSLKYLLVINAGVIITLFASKLFIWPSANIYKKLFGCLNLSMFFVLGLAVADRFFSGN
jgi:protoheme IX farnesyltransferase